MLLENIITSDVIGKYIMGRLTNIGKYSSWSLILEASLHKIYWLILIPMTALDDTFVRDIDIEMIL